MKGGTFKETSSKHVYETKKGKMCLSYSPGEEYHFNGEDIAKAKETGCAFFAIIAPYTPVTHEEVVILKTQELIDYFKGRNPYEKVEGTNLLKINYDKVCDLSLFMLTLR